MGVLWTFWECVDAVEGCDWVVCGGGLERLGKRGGRVRPDGREARGGERTRSALWGVGRDGVMRRYVEPVRRWLRYEAYKDPG